ncbi:hypothetical protein [Ekhidna sp.]|uniref:hypothetical protein n=1 Tax=Ekhidna sp. TaxID=2608089 RepID=UPI0032992575
MSTKKSDILKLIIGVSLVILPIIGMILIYQLWPETVLENGKQNWKVCSSTIFGCNTCISSEKRVILLVIISGFLGSYVHITTSFSNFVGNGKFESSWLWWYILRPLVGMTLALIFYLVFRGGLFAGDTSAMDLNLFGVLTISALSGLFSDRATLKLAEIYDSLFKPEDNREGKLNN